MKTLIIDCPLKGSLRNYLKQNETMFRQLSDSIFVYIGRLSPSEKIAFFEQHYTILRSSITIMNYSVIYTVSQIK